MIGQRRLTAINTIEIDGCVVGIMIRYEHIQQKCDELKFSKIGCKGVCNRTTKSDYILPNIQY